MTQTGSRALQATGSRQPILPLAGRFEAVGILVPQADGCDALSRSQLFQKFAETKS
jgi:hypothetical protein